MVLFFSSGRLGNQLFQYAFINTIKNKNEKVIVSGFEDLKEVFDICGIINIPKKNRIIRGIIYRLLAPLLLFLGNIRLINKIEVVYDSPDEYKQTLPKRESSCYVESAGLLKFIRFIKLGYFQSEKFFDNAVKNCIHLKSEYIDKANKFLRDIPQDATKIFIHIRRGDYKEYKVFGKSTLLPMTYYKNLIDYFLSEYDKCFFIFLSDEPENTEKEFNYLSNKKFSKNNHPGTDFAIITMCSNGILSTSTFSWWAAYLIKNKKVIFAPKHWLGFNSQKEFPVGGFPSFAREIII